MFNQLPNIESNFSVSPQQIVAILIYFTLCTVHAYLPESTKPFLARYSFELWTKYLYHYVGNTVSVCDIYIRVIVNHLTGWTCLYSVLPTPNSSIFVQDIRSFPFLMSGDCTVQEQKDTVCMSLLFASSIITNSCEGQ